jgi:uncharacterized protein YoxC
MNRKKIEALIDQKLKEEYCQQARPLLGAVGALRQAVEELNESVQGLAGRVSQLEADDDTREADEETQRLEKSFLEGLSNLVNFDVNRVPQ